MLFEVRYTDNVRYQILAATSRPIAVTVEALQVGLLYETPLMTLAPEPSDAR